MECPICLELISPSTIVGRIHNCAHEYHEKCVLQWSTHSNSCPTCRKSYYGIDIIEAGSPHFVIRSLAIKDKLLATDSINEIPEEFVIPPPVYSITTQPQIGFSGDAEAAQNGVCIICSSAQISSRRSPLISCINCEGKFHSACLGRTTESSWFCPFCDCHQEFLAANGRGASLISVRGSERPSVLRDESPQVAAKVTTSARRGRLLLSDASESDFGANSLYRSDWEDEPPIQDFQLETSNAGRTRAAWNGGMLLRKQARELQNLSPEERSSWSMLESARNGGMAETSGSQTPEPSTRKKRRRPPGSGPSEEPGNTASAKIVTKSVPSANQGTNIRHGQGTSDSHEQDTSNSHEQDTRISRRQGTNNTRDISSTDGLSRNNPIRVQEDDHSAISGNETDPSKTRPSGSSRIALLMNQIKSRSQPKAPTSITYPENQPSPSLAAMSIHPKSAFQTPNGSLSSLGSRSQSPAFSVTSNTSDDTMPIDKNLTPRPLKLDEKRMVQAHVRSHLLPLYNGTKLVQHKISSEEEFIRINKQLSRQIYASISSLCVSQGAGIYEELFNGKNDQLKNLVDSHVKGWAHDKK